MVQVIELHLYSRPVFRTWTWTNLNELERTWTSVVLGYWAFIKKHERPWAISVLISVLIPARKQRCAPYDVDKVYFFVVDNAESLLHPKTSVNGPTKLHFRSGNSHGISYRLQEASYKLQVTSYRIWLQITITITEYKIQVTSCKL